MSKIELIINGDLESVCQTKNIAHEELVLEISGPGKFSAKSEKILRPSRGC